MRYTPEVIYNSSKRISSKLNVDPALVRKRLNAEPELYQHIKQYAESIPGLEDEHLEIIISSVFYGFMLKEELLREIKEKQTK